AVVLGRDGVSAVLVGLPRGRWPAAVDCVEGRLPADGPLNEFAVGTELARRLGLGVGSLIPPFYHNDQGERVSRVVGVFKSDVSLWQANLILTTLDTALAVFNQRGLATDLLVDCRPGYQESVRAQIEALGPLGPAVAPRVTAREDLQALLPVGLR